MPLRKVNIIIPARMGSSRLPGKPLKMIGDKTMIQRVYERCEKSEASEVYVAAAGKIEERPDYFINVQGDEPFISQHFLKMFIRDIYSLRTGNILTGASELKDFHLLNKNSVKLIHDKDDNVISFTRSPFFGRSKNILKHVGIYGFCFSDLDKIQNISPTEESKSSSLEQISWMQNGFSIRYTMCYQESVCVDTQEDLDLAREMVLLDKNP